MPHPLIVLPVLLLQPHQPQRTLVFLGDSLTAGFGLAQEQAFPALIEGRIRSAGLPWKVVNAGVTGDTTAGVRARLEWILKQRPALIFLCIGSNDGLRGLPIREIERNLKAILDRCGREKVPVVLAGALLPENYGPEYREAFRALFPRLAKANGLPFLPFLLEGVALKPELNQADGIHPNHQGSRVIADRVWATLERDLKQPR
jgi:acyl-CoA thioesterase-1